MTFDNDQLSTILLLIETSQLQEPELSEAWALLKHIQDSKMTTTINSWNQVDGSTRHVMPGPHPVCDGCDCVAACSNVKDKACLPAVQPPTAQATNPQKPPSIEIDFKQATELLELFGGEPSSVTVMGGLGHSGEGLYASYADMPEDGAYFLGVADEEAIPAQPVQPAEQDDLTTAYMAGLANGRRIAQPQQSAAMPDKLTDSDRMDWLEKTNERGHYCGIFNGNLLTRKAIDAAIQQGGDT